jgi:hypothetical protein
MKLRLGSSGLANIAKAENDFAFIVGNQCYKCPWFVADFLSPRVGQLHSVDSTVNEFVIETKDEKDQFEEFLSFGRGAEVEVNEANRRFLLSVSAELGNCELYFSLSDSLETNGLLSRFCEDFNREDLLGCLNEKAIEFVATHFFELEQSYLNDLPIDVLSHILGHPSVALKSEDWLFNFIISRCASHLESVTLLEFVRFEFLRKSTIEKFVSWSLEHFDELDFTISLWRTITNRLSQGGDASVPSCHRYREWSCPRDISPLDGIIAGLTRKHGGNVHDRGIVDVSGTSACGSNVAQNAVDLEEHQRNCFESRSEPNQWLCYYFDARRIELTAYSIAARPNGPFLRSWIVEGSEDGLTWITLDERKDNTEANSSHPIATFVVSNRMECRFIRLRQTGNNASGDHRLRLYGFEVFGFMEE